MKGNTIRTLRLLAVASVMLLAACASRSDEAGGGGGASASAGGCEAGQLPLLKPGTLTVGTDVPAFQPWFGGTGSYQQWKGVPANGTGNPASGDGFESAVTYAIADQLGLAHDEVAWVPVPFNESFKPGDKGFDFDINEISYNPERAQVVTFSDGYYDVQQALVAKKGTPIANATTFDELKQYKLGAQIGTTSYQYITDNIRPDQQPSVYDKSPDVIAALNAGQIDGYLTDAPTAYVNVLISQVEDGVVVGQFPTIGQQEYFGLVLQKGNPLVDCLNDAIAALRDDGTLQQLQRKWLKPVTFPEIQQ
jgi:polar amino acid transport system substrate-binding protein